MMPRVCFATPGAYPMLASSVSVLGGSELRALRLMRGLAHRGIPLSMAAFIQRDRRLALEWANVHVVSDPSGLPRSLIDRLLRRYRGTKGREDAWARAEADVYVGFGAADYNADLAGWCRRTSRSMVLMLGSDLDCSATYQIGDKGLNPYGSVNENCRRALDEATTIVAQTDWQAAEVARQFGRTAAVLPNPVDVATLAPRARRYFLWVGKSSTPKQPEHLLAIAKRLPDLKFRMILNRADVAIDDEIRRQQPPNLEIVAAVSPDRMSEQYAAAFALVNTSMFEGMPNTFLEAGMQGTPVLSLSVDPDEMLMRSGGGRCADGNSEQLVELVSEIARSPSLGREMGAALQRYVAERHAAGPVFERFTDLILEAAR